MIERGGSNAGRFAPPAILGPLIALAVLLAFNAAFTTGFANLEMRDGRLYGAIVDILKNGSPVMLLSIGLTCVIALGGIDLSVGSVMALSAAAAAKLITEHDQPFAVAMLAGLCVGLACGLLNGVAVRWGRVAPIVATLVMLLGARGIAQVLTGGQKVPFENAAFASLAQGTLLFLPAPLWVVAGVASLAAIALRRATIGWQLQAAGVNARAAAYSGLPIGRITLVAYGFAGLCAAIAGMIAAADISEADVANAGLYMELDAILAVVIGGTLLTGGRAQVLGSLVGAVFMQTLTVSLLMRGVQAEHTLLIKGAAVLGVCLLRSPPLWAWLRGLFAGALAKRERAA